jgi:RNA polymerase sigma-70 factor (ECF subfamily)
MSLVEASAGMARDTAVIGDIAGVQRDPAARAAAETETLYLALVHRHYESIVRYIHGMVSSREQAEDLTQDTFLKAYLALSHTGTPANARAWLFRIASNTTLDHVRRKRRIGMVALEKVSHVLFGEDRASRVEEAGPVDAALGALRSEDRSVLLLFAEAGFSAPEVALILDITPAAARKRRQRAREAFMAAYEEASREV